MEDLLLMVTITLKSHFHRFNLLNAATKLQKAMMNILKLRIVTKHISSFTQIGRLNIFILHKRKN